jgi:hypothetical protein
LTTVTTRRITQQPHKRKKRRKQGDEVRPLAKDDLNVDRLFVDVTTIVVLYLCLMSVLTLLLMGGARI